LTQFTADYFLTAPERPHQCALLRTLRHFAHDDRTCTPHRHGGFVTATAVDPRVKEFTARRWQLLTDGKWVKAKSEQTFQTHNLATGELLAECAQADEVDIDRAVRAARRAFESGPGRR
jgi:hypothetical protein